MTTDYTEADRAFDIAQDYPPERDAWDAACDLESLLRSGKRIRKAEKDVLIQAAAICRRISGMEEAA
jgi:hypothetical protein